jgi:hypothetical protein
MKEHVRTHLGICGLGREKKGLSVCLRKRREEAVEVGWEKVKVCFGFRWCCLGGLVGGLLIPAAVAPILQGREGKGREGRAGQAREQREEKGTGGTNCVQPHC